MNNQQGEFNEETKAKYDRLVNQYMKRLQESTHENMLLKVFVEELEQHIKDLNTVLEQSMTEKEELREQLEQK